MARRRQDHISAERLREILDYDPTTGNLTWRYRPNASTQWNGKHAGKTAGGPSPNGYIQIMLKPRLYRAQRLAWLWMTGEWPDHDIDHDNTNRADNAWENLRPATNSQNLMNRGATKRNPVALKGVSYHRQTGKWRARITVRYREIYLGLFESPEDAYLAYCAAVGEHHGEFARVA